MELLGRIKEQKTFRHCMESTESKLIAVYGRRRVGKTFLIRKYFENDIRFEVSGLYQADMQDQITHFTKSIAKQGYYEASIAAPTNWIDVFELLSLYITGLKDKKKKVLFIDELPWLDTPRSKFLTAFENFWNSFCSKRSDLLVVICGSAASWMIKKILKNKGGLHNRVSEKIKLVPFNLNETEKFLKFKGIKWSRYDIAQLYMTTGGVPYYLDAVRKGESVIQFVDRVCFDPQGILYDEFDELYASLFDNSDHHKSVVQVLAKVQQGLTRSKIIENAKIPSGGTLTKVLDELDKSGFISVVTPFNGNKNGVLYKLTDAFTIFHLKFMDTGKSNAKDSWAKTVMSQSWVSWSGFAFERLCFSHIGQIKAALGLSIIETKDATWHLKEADKGAQIDLLIDRSDRVVNLCEIKFARAEFTIDKEYASQLRNKIDKFGQVKVNKRKNIFLTMITTFGVLHNEYYHELVQSEVVLDDLFL